MRLIYVFIAFTVITQTQSCKSSVGNGSSSDQKTITRAGGPDSLQQDAALAAVKVLVEKELTIAVSLKSSYFKANDSAAFVAATILKKDGGRMDFKGTPYHEQANVGGSFSDAVFGLLKKQGETWKVKGISVGATDVPFVCWPKAYKVSATIFPEGAISGGCEELQPFIFLSDEGRLSLDGGINISLAELKEQLIELLGNMDSIPDEITPEFGGKVDADGRAALTRVVLEAILEARKVKGK